MSTNRSERLKNLSPQKRAILLKALGKEAVQAEQSKRIPRRSQQNYADKPSGLPELPVQYADFASWQRQHFQGEKLEKQLASTTPHFLHSCSLVGKFCSGG